MSSSLSRLSYSEMIQFGTFEERFNYLALHGRVGFETFGHDRYMNQGFYTSREWKAVRRAVILRDNNCDLAFPDREIVDRVLIHHLNPITPEDIIHSTDALFSMDNLVAVTHRTHNAIHYGDESLLQKDYVPRTPGDTKLW